MTTMTFCAPDWSSWREEPERIFPAQGIVQQKQGILGILEMYFRMVSGIIITSTCIKMIFYIGNWSVNSYLGWHFRKILCFWDASTPNMSGIITCISAVVSAIGLLVYKKGIMIPRGHVEHSFDPTCKMTLGWLSWWNSSFWNDFKQSYGVQTYTYIAPLSLFEIAMALCLIFTLFFFWVH